MAAPINDSSTGTDATFWTAFIALGSLEKQVAALNVELFKREKAYNAANPTANQLTRVSVATDYRNNNVTFGWTTTISDSAIESGLVPSISAYL